MKRSPIEKTLLGAMYRDMDPEKRMERKNLGAVIRSGRRPLTTLVVVKFFELSTKRRFIKPNLR